MSTFVDLKRENASLICDWVPSASNGRVDFYPRYVQLEHTNYCNARCIMCNHFFLGNRGTSEISREVIESVVPILPTCEQIMLNGDGEPFLYRGIIDAVDLYASYNVRIGTNTNLCYVPDSLWPYLRSSFSFLNVSCDGATKETFELIRRGLSFESFLGNVERLRTEAPGLRKNLDCVLMRQNVRELVQLVELASEYGFDTVKLHHLGVNPCIGNADDADEAFPGLAAKMVDEARAAATDLGLVLEAPSFGTSEWDANDWCSLGTLGIWREEVERRLERSTREFGHLSLETDYLDELATKEGICDSAWHAGRVCQWAVERCYIDLKGNVTTCCFNTRRHMGNLHDQTFDEIWNGELYRLFRMKMAQGWLPSWCQGCNWIRDSKY